MSRPSKSQLFAPKPMRLAGLFLGLMTLFALPSLQASAQPVSVVTPSRWMPAPDARFDLQFSTPMQLQRTVDFLVLDLNDALPDEISQIRGRGAAAVCYFDGGTMAEDADDFGSVPPLAVGRQVEQQPNQRWLDIRDIDAIAPMIQGRLDLCRDKGFDGALVGNLENYLFRTGFPIGERQQQAFNRFIADEAHQRGLSIGLWNSRSQIAPLSMDYDFVVLSGCFEDGWCNESQPFLDQTKPAFLVEFAESARSDLEFCRAAQSFGAMGIIKRQILDGWLRLCPPPDIE